MSTVTGNQTLYHFIVGMLLYSILALSPAQAETTNCTAVTSLPYVITTQGIYCFTGHLSTSMTSGYAILINTNNVTIDMNGYKLGGLGAGTGTNAVGIYASQRKNIIIRNGIVRGFFQGIFLDDPSPYITSQGHLVEDILADQNTYAGIVMQGEGMTIRRTQVMDTGGSSQKFAAYGVIIYGAGNDVLNNQITATTSTGSSSSHGIYLLNAGNSVVLGNRLNSITSPGGNGFGIYVTISSDVMVRENTVTTTDYGIRYLSSTGKYMDNLTGNIGVQPFSGGTPVGTNN